LIIFVDLRRGLHLTSLLPAPLLGFWIYYATNGCSVLVHSLFNDEFRKIDRGTSPFVPCDIITGTLLALIFVRLLIGGSRDQG
jgi:hypothetical protein